MRSMLNEQTGHEETALRKVYNETTDIRALPHGEKIMKYTRFEKARIIGARSLQVSLGAPVLIDIPEGMIDPVEIAMLEFEKGIIPITVKREE
jgi:DNA-directed RNA polymerase subunit K